MSTPDGHWEEADESLPLRGLIAADQFEIMAGGVVTEDGMTPAVAVRVAGVLASEVNTPGAPRVQSTFLLRTEDVERFAAQVIEASKARPA